MQKRINKLNVLSDYTRCGRTDKGVSSFGNVISLKLRAKKPAEGEENKTEDRQSELNYCQMLNGCLPPEIRILSCTPCPDDFNSRYYFEKKKAILNCIDMIVHIEYINISSSKEIWILSIWQRLPRSLLVTLISVISAKSMSSVLSASSNPSEFEQYFNSLPPSRVVLDVTVDKVDGLNQSVIEDDRLDLYAFTIKGNAFLWHQVIFPSTPSITQ